MDAALAPILPKRLNLFERYLTVWVGLCMVAGIVLGQSAPAAVQLLRSMEFGQGSHVNFPIAVLIWLMIIPMMMKVDFSVVRDVGKRPRGLLVTLFVNWIVKPFSMAFLAWLFFRFVFSAWMTQADADQYIAGAIILATGPGLHAGASVGERPHHAGAVCAARRLSGEWRVIATRALCSAALFGAGLYRHSVNHRRVAPAVVYPQPRQGLV